MNDSNSGLEYMVIGLLAIWFVLGSSFALQVLLILGGGYLFFIVADWDGRK